VGDVTTVTQFNPYHLIHERNVFALKPAPKVIRQPPAAPSSTIYLTGIATIGDKRALLKICFPAARGVQARQELCILGVGESEAEVRVLEIDEKAGSVLVNSSGTETVLTFEKNGVPKQPILPGAGFQRAIPSASRGQSFSMHSQAAVHCKPAPSLTNFTRGFARTRLWILPLPTRA
jgi:hypothetical protein